MDIKEEFTDIYGGRKKVRLNKKEKVLIKLIKTELTKKIIGGETIADYINTKIENSKYHKFTHKYTNYEICKIKLHSYYIYSLDSINNFRNILSFALSILSIPL